MKEGSVVSPWASGPKFSKKKQAYQAMIHAQVSKEHPSMASAPAPASRFLPCSCSCPDFFSGEVEVEVEAK